MKVEVTKSEVMKANQIQTFTDFLGVVVAKLNEGLILTSQGVMNRDVQNVYKKKSDSVELTVRIPSGATDHNPSGNAATDFKEGKRIVKLDKELTVDHEFSFSEMQQQISDGKTEVIDSMVDGLIDKIEDYAMDQIARGALGYTGTPGTTISAYSSLLAARKFFTKYRVPRANRFGMLDANVTEKMLDVDVFKNAQFGGGNAALVEAELGRRAGISWYESPFIKTYTITGTFEGKNKTTTGTVVVANNSTLTDGLPYSSVIFKAASDTSHVDISKGAQGTITDDSGVTHNFVVLEAATSTTSGSDEVVTTKIYPALTTACSGTAVTFAGKNLAAGVKNIIMQKDCVYLASRPLEPYPDKMSMTIMTDVGIPLRMSLGSSQTTKKTILTLDAILKVYVARPEGVAVIYG